MDIFQKENNKIATILDWNCPRYVKRCKGDTERLHRYSRRKLKQKLKKEIKEDE